MSYRLREALRLGSIDPWADSVYWKSAPSPPPAPDYTGSAQATAAGNKENLQFQTNSNRYNQYTPYGSQTWTGGDPNTGAGWSSSINLDPTAKATLDTQMRLSQQMGNTAEGQVGRVNQSFAQPFDQSQVSPIQSSSATQTSSPTQTASQGSDVAYRAATSRLDPQWKQNDQTQASTLANQGITQGSEAYNNAMRTYGENKNDAYTQARGAALQQGLAEANLNNSAGLAQANLYNQANLSQANLNNQASNQQIQQQQTMRNIPLNEFNAFRTGAQVQNPQFQSTPAAGYTAGPDLLGAAGQQNQYNMGLYNSGVGTANSSNAGMAQLAGTAGMFLMSDRRLKSNVKRIGTHKLGIGIYEYDIAGIHATGVMADEVESVMPEAVHTLPSGFKMVNYALL